MGSLIKIRGVVMKFQKNCLPVNTGRKRMPMMALLFSTVISSVAGTSMVLAGDLDQIDKPQETDVKPTPVVPSVAPTPSPVTPAPTVAPIPSPVPLSDGVMEFGVRAVSNMENAYHIMDDGYYAQCVDDQGVVAQAKMDAYAAANGEAADNQSQGGYQAVKLRPKLEYLRSKSGSGNCKLTVCLPKGEFKAGQQFECDGSVHQARQVSGDSSRPVELKSLSAQYTASGQDIALSTNYPLVSAFHPVYSFAAPGKSFKDFQSPIVLQFNKKSSLDLVDVWAQSEVVRFDLVGDHQPVRTGWVSKTAKGTVGFLAIDLNNNGKIDHGGELFGEYTQLGSPKKADGHYYDNGFQALATFDSNHDGVIDAKDKEFDRLVVWFDKNANAVSESGEVQNLRAAKVKSISLAYSENNENGKPVQVAGNELRLKSTMTLTNGEQRPVYDVWFNQRRFAERQMVSQ
jgi:hypothetical protein